MPESGASRQRLVSALPPGLQLQNCEGLARTAHNAVRGHAPTLGGLDEIVARCKF